MSKVTQTIFAGDSEGRVGNCMQAAVASLLDLQLEDVPHFCAVPDWLSYLAIWSAQRGWAVRHRNADEPVVFGIACGPSPRGVEHATVMIDGEIVWDPHPSRDGLLSIARIWEFTAADPASLRDQWLPETPEERLAQILAEPPMRRLTK